MDKWMSSYIKESKPELCDNTECTEKLMDSLKAKKVLTKEETDKVKNKDSSYGQASALYDYLVTRKKAYHTIIDLLRAENQDDAADILENGRKKHMPEYNNQLSVEESQPDCSSVSSTSSSDTSKHMHIDVPGDGKELNDEGVINLEDIMTPLTVLVRKPKKPMSEIFKDNYNLPSISSKGSCLILNFLTFNTHSHRRGAHLDTLYMGQLWSQLGYDIYPRNEGERYKEYRNKEEAEKLMDDFKEECISTQAKSIVVFIGSHGYFGGVVTSDEEILHLHNDIVYRFNGTEFKGKAKIFLISACQGFSSEPGIPHCHTVAQPPMDDTFIMLPQVAGYNSKRDILFGSWFSYFVTKVFMEFACECNIFQLQHKVNRNFRRIKTKDGEVRQMVSVHWTGLDELYFFMNP